MKKKTTLNTHKINWFTLLLFFCIAPISALENTASRQYTNQKERVTKFHSDITIDTTGTVLVSEHIDVYVKGIDFKRGLIRDVNIYRKDINGKRKKIDIEVLSVTRNGIPEEYETELNGDDRSILLGNNNFLETEREHKYVITYKSRGHIGFFDDYDELYWNVTGNDWIFKIESVSATMHLPKGAHALTSACYTGHKGSTEKSCSYITNDTVVTFEAGKSLNPREGLTVATSFTPNIIKRPPPPSRWETFIAKNINYICGIVGLIIMSTYTIVTSIVAGKRIKFTPIPTFNPPNGWSPADIRYLKNKTVDNKSVTATILSMAVKGSLSISQIKKKFILIAKEQTLNLTSEELKVYTSLFSNSPRIEMSEANQRTLYKTDTILKCDIENRWKLSDYTKSNYKFKIIAVLLGCAIPISHAYFTEDPFIFMLFAAIAFLSVGIGISSLFFKKEIPFGSFFFFGLIPIAIGGGLISILLTKSPILLIFDIPIMVILFVYLFRIKRDTEKGARVKADIEGFRMYLKTAEERRLNLLTPPEHTPELFEKLLPYAVALDLENEWNKKFISVLKAANYTPTWHKGVYSANFTNSLSRSFTKTYDRAKTPPSSSSSSSSGSRSWSSGSSGGGSSGGGGGGGGGRGR